MIVFNLPSRAGVRLCAMFAIASAAVVVTGLPAAASPGICGERPLVYLDIGHSPNRPGAISARGKTEYRFNLRLVREMAAAFAADRAIDVKILNLAGADLSLRQRAEEIRALETGLLLSIHHDSVQPKYIQKWEFQGKSRHYSDRFSGFSLFVSGRAPSFGESKRLAKSIGVAMTAAGMRPSLHHAEPIPGENRPLIDKRIGLHDFAGLAVLKKTRIPAVLVEVGIIVNRDDELRLETAAFRKKVIAALARGVKSFCAVK